MSEKTNSQSTTLPPKPYKITPKEVYAGDGYGGCRKPEADSKR